MKCPICNVDLVMADRLGVEIDYCPQCRGIWLDRGELDKIIERSVPGSVGSTPRTPEVRGPEYPPYEYRKHGEHHGHDDDDYEHERDGRYDSDYPRKKKKSFLGELFDF